MENRKIIDYVVISDQSQYFEIDNSNFFQENMNLERLKNDLKGDLRLIKLNELKLEAIDSLLQMELNKVYAPFNEKETFRLYHLLNLDIFRNAKEFEISDDLKPKLQEKKIQIENSIIKSTKDYDNSKSKVEQTELQLEVRKEIRTHTESLKSSSSVVWKMQQYANDGYVLQGGYYTRDGYGYQAMVKYEE